MRTLQTPQSTARSSHRTRSQPRPTSVHPVRTLRTQLEREFCGLHRKQPRLLRLALDEAEALAWQTGFPHLWFPVLAKEKAEAIARWDWRQNRIRQAASMLAFAE
jgi:hypothetical protein